MDDLVQNVFLEVCRALPGFRGDSAVSTFIGGITVRVARRAMRPTAYARLRGPMPAEPAARAQPPEARAAAVEQLRRLHEALAQLTPEKRIAFVLWAIEGNEVADIAEVMGASISATRSRIFYAQKELKALAAADPYLSELLEAPDA
jgi:RNA polymerase sigma-70 factor (ECF subfamily)